MSIVEYEEINGGATGNILAMVGATSLAANASYRNFTADPFGDALVDFSIFAANADDGDVLRIECWQGNYPGLTKLGEVRVLFTKLTLTLQDLGGANDAKKRADDPAADGRLVARVLRGTTGINGVPLILRSENTAGPAVDKYVFSNVSHTGSGSFACPTPANDQRTATTATVGGLAGTAQQDVYWQCDAGTTGTPEAGVFRVYWDANQDGSVTGDPYVQVTQSTSSTPIS